nr:glycerol-3-phosphate acyltransferase, chloroplastic [Tanacetum cinerariifolium]
MGFCKKIMLREKSNNVFALYIKDENVILISNHQTEADPATIALLLETTRPCISENAKHMNDVPELAKMKWMANTRTLKEMALLLRGGSKLIWIVASGGRDRPDPITNQWFPAPFDASSVDNMRRVVEHDGVSGHEIAKDAKIIEIDNQLLVLIKRQVKTALMLDEKFRDLCEEVSNSVKEIEDVVKEVERLSCKDVAKEAVCLLRRAQKRELYMMTRLQLMADESHLSVREKHVFVSKMNLGRLD